MAKNYSDNNAKFEISQSYFVNPYNFVSIDLNKDTKENRYKNNLNEEKYTGEIKCNILVKTPLSIPMVTGECEQKEYRFMRIDKSEDSAIIPGSSIRGVVRNVFETATDSCFSTLKEDTGITARATTNEGLKFKAGVLYYNANEDGQGKWELFTATRYMLKVRRGDSKGANADVWNDKICPTYRVEYDKDIPYIEDDGVKYRSGDTVNFTALMVNNREYIYKSQKNKECATVVKRITKTGKKGILVLGESFSKKHHESIFCVDNSKKVDINDAELQKAVKTLNTIHDIYGDKAINKQLYDGVDGKKKHRGYASYETMKKKGCMPIWYNYDNGKLYLSFAQIGRKQYSNTLNVLVNKKVPCTSRENTCEACSLFGMIANNQEAIGSRIRFTDAKITRSAGYKMYELAELGQPRPSYMPFYSTARIDSKNRTVGYDSNNVNIRGRKFYWHSTNYDTVNGPGKGSSRSQNVEALLPNSQLAFSIFFDEITKKELERLIWSLNFGENDNDGRYCHKMGHGKPLGLGSVKVTVDSVEIRNFENSVYEIKDIFDQLSVADAYEETRTIKELKRICDFNWDAELRKAVSYPELDVSDEYIDKAIKNKEENKIARHQWFTENKTVRNVDGDDKVQCLKNIMEKDQKLYKYKYTDDFGIKDISKNDNKQITRLKGKVVNSRGKLEVDINGKKVIVSGNQMSIAMLARGQEIVVTFDGNNYEYKV